MAVHEFAEIPDRKHVGILAEAAIHHSTIYRTEMKLRLMKRIRLALYGPAVFQVRKIHSPSTLGGCPIDITVALVEGFVYRGGRCEEKAALFRRDETGQWHPQNVHGDPRLQGVEIPSNLNTALEERYRKALRASTDRFA